MFDVFNCKIQTYDVGWNYCITTERINMLYFFSFWQDSFQCMSWTNKHPKMAQPDLDFMAPEIQLEPGKMCTVLCDMYSLGMVICAIYNNGRSLIQANHNPNTYAKKIDQVGISCSGSFRGIYIDLLRCHGKCPILAALWPIWKTLIRLRTELNPLSSSRIICRIVISDRSATLVNPKFN